MCVSQEACKNLKAVEAVYTNISTQLFQTVFSSITPYAVSRGYFALL